jgi:uncharacterized protein YdeI (YjbR/CyaY-like superfamily)
MTRAARAEQPASDVQFFETPAALCDWFTANHATAVELWLGFHKVGTGRPSVTWAEVVDEALCVGWIDGVRKRIDDETWKIRLTPRRKGSIWSAVNIARVPELEAAGRMQPTGRRAFEARDEARSAIYSYERAIAALSAADEVAFRANAAAWVWFEKAAPSYRRAATHWVTSAAKPETRARRLATLIEDSAAGRTVKPLTPPTGSKERP